MDQIEVICKTQTGEATEKANSFKDLCNWLEKEFRRPTRDGWPEAVIYEERTYENGVQSVSLREKNERIIIQYKTIVK